MTSNDNSEQPNIGSSEARMFKNSNEFSLYIESVVASKKVNYMDAVLEYCKENQVEPEDIAKLINRSLKDKIEMNFRELNYLPKQAQLDV